MKKCGIFGILLMCIMLIGATACSGGEETAIQQPVETTKSDINVTVTGDGNIEALFHERLTFGSGGKIDKIFVKEGDKVSKGDVLARLDTSALELAEAQAQVALTQAQVALAQSRVAHTEAQVTQDNVNTTLSRAKVAESQAIVAQYQAEVNRVQAKVALETAKFNLDRMKDVQELKDDIERAELAAKMAEIGMKQAIQSKDVNAGNWAETVAGAKLNLSKLQEDLIQLLAKDEYTTLIVDEVKIKALQVDAAEWSLKQTEKTIEQSRLTVELAKQEVESAKHSLELVQQNVELAQQNVELAQQNVNLAQKSLDQAQKYLGEATIVAPFDGIVSKIGVKEGEFLSPAAYTGTTIVQLIDPRHMELTARIDELDVVRVKTGQKVMISVDAMPGTMLEGRVTFISPVARDPGVLLFESDDEEKEYEVKIDFDIPNDSPIRAGMSATAEIIVE